MNSTDTQPRPRPRIIPRAEHPISRANISSNALKVLYRLKNAGYSDGGVARIEIARNIEAQPLIKPGCGVNVLYDFCNSCNVLYCAVRSVSMALYCSRA